MGRQFAAGAVAAVIRLFVGVIPHVFDHFAPWRLGHNLTKTCTQGVQVCCHGVPGCRSRCRVYQTESMSLYRRTDGLHEVRPVASVSGNGQISEFIDDTGVPGHEFNHAVWMTHSGQLQ